MATTTTTPTTTPPNLSGTFILNKTLSDPSDSSLKLQSISWLMRQAISIASVTLTITQITDASTGVVHITAEQIASPGGTRNLEERVLDWEWRERDDRIWGKVRARNKFVKVSEIEDSFLKDGWSDDCISNGVMRSEVESVGDTWTALQIWGLAVIEGKERHVRRIITKKGTTEIKIRMVYDPKP